MEGREGRGGDKMKIRSEAAPGVRQNCTTGLCVCVWRTVNPSREWRLL